MVDPDWQGAGLGGILHDRAIEYARNHNVRGFTADVIVGNSRMLRVFRHGNHQINVTTEAGISEVTIIFPLSRDHHSETCGKWTEHLWPM